jgi:broad specificity phosphatase PhoE
MCITNTDVFFIAIISNFNSYVSPRLRARRTLELLGIGSCDKLPWQDSRPYGDEHIRCYAKIEVTDRVREWDYGDYEGLTSKTIQQQRQEKGLGPWDIWSEGCPGGE